MAKTIESTTFDGVMRDVLETLVNNPEHICSPRDSKVHECIANTLVLRNPRARLISSPSREVNIGFAIGEFLWYWRGSRDLETMVYYNKRMVDFSDDGLSLNSAYGHRLRKQFVFAGGSYGTGLNQWEVATETLKQDKDSRRCVLHINGPEDQRNAITFIGSKDVPCTLSLQFFIRNNKLDLHVVMRSNDVIWGLTYDLFSFTMLQELMMLELRETYPELQIGKYYHTAGSLHLYEKHFQMAKNMLAEFNSASFSPLPPMEELDVREINELAYELEPKLRKKSIDRIDITQFKNPSSIYMVAFLNEHRRKRDRENVSKVSAM